MTADTQRAADVRTAAQIACLLEVSAPKPGNVSPGRHFADARYEHFVASAVAIGDPLGAACTRPLGTTVRLAIEETARWAPSNTNLGIVLLFAPLARAALEKHTRPLFPTENSSELAIFSINGGSSDCPQEMTSGFLFRDLRDAVREVLAATTIEDAREVYRAIRLAAPGGLGQVGAQDVAQEPDVTLLEAMRLAADRDGIAREYVTGFETTFEIGAPALVRARHDQLSWDDAIVETFLTLLTARPDTHIARRGGVALAADVSQRARDAFDAGGVRSEAGRRAIDEMDRASRVGGHIRNPGTTADLTAAAIFVWLLCGGWRQSR